MTGWKNHHLKIFLHLLFKIRDFPPSHLSFRGGTYTFSMRTRGLLKLSLLHPKHQDIIRELEFRKGWRQMPSLESVLGSWNLCFHPNSLRENPGKTNGWKLFSGWNFSLKKNLLKRPVFPGTCFWLLLILLQLAAFFFSAWVPHIIHSTRTASSCNSK